MITFSGRIFSVFFHWRFKSVAKRVSLLRGCFVVGTNGTVYVGWLVCSGGEDEDDSSKKGHKTKDNNQRKDLRGGTANRATEELSPPVPMMTSLDNAIILSDVHKACELLNALQRHFI
jgi:hypothetical protein